MKKILARLTVFARLFELLSARYKLDGDDMENTEFDDLSVSEVNADNNKEKKNIPNDKI